MQPTHAHVAVSWERVRSAVPTLQLAGTSIGMILGRRTPEPTSFCALALPQNYDYRQSFRTHAAALQDQGIEASRLHDRLLCKSRSVLSYDIAL